MRLRHIEIFNAVMSAGSISGAARLLNLTQPAVSRTLQHAELQLGIALFHRAKGRLTPTPDALALYPHIEKLFQQLDEVQRLAGNLKAGHSGQELRILITLALSYVVLPRAIQLFREKYPSVAISVMSVHSSELVTGLALQEADVGLLLSSMVHPALTNEPLVNGRMVCVARTDLLPTRLRRRKSVTLADLVDLPVISLDANDPLGRNLSQACRDAEVQLKSDVTVQTYHAALAFAHHGLGVALVDSFTALSADAALMTVLPLEPLVPVTLQAMRPSTKAPLSSVKDFLACVKQVVQHP